MSKRNKNQNYFTKRLKVCTVFTNYLFFFFGSYRVNKFLLLYCVYTYIKTYNFKIKENSQTKINTRATFLINDIISTCGKMATGI